ncbi:MAG TPA: class I SAM-dependent rRNA methyltransferase [Alphaproteobacteria bacterium]|nr:class I SAM-dependent rRNA methyltransferase [Alphaproteobacteria bacterium]
MKKRPTVRLQPRHDARLRHGHPWAYSNEIMMDAEAKAIPPGTPVTLTTAGGERLGAGWFNPHTLIAARVLTADTDTVIDRAFYAGRIAAAVRLRERLYPEPYYRLVHAEADGLPSVVIDRMGDVLVVQLNAAGPNLAEQDIVGALVELLNPSAIVLKNDSPARNLEGLALETRLVHGELSGPVELRENGARFLIDPMEGQKTGWFYDQRDSRAFVARFAAGRSVLDAYCYGGGFGIAAAMAGAQSVTLLDRSAGALEAAGRSAALNGVGERCTVRQQEVFEALAEMAEAKQTFDVVIVDPPAFAKSRKDIPTAVKGYRKLVRQAVALVPPGGILFAASCSHNVGVPEFSDAVARGLADAGRTGRVLRTAGAGPDHPVHPMLPESAYLKSLTLALD